MLRLAQLNRELNKFDQHGDVTPDWIARRDAILSSRSNDPPYAPSPKEVAEYADDYSASTRWVCERFAIDPRVLTPRLDD